MTQVNAWLFDALGRRVGHYAGDEGDLPANTPPGGSFELTTSPCPQGPAAIGWLALDRYLHGHAQ